MSTEETPPHLLTYDFAKVINLFIPSYIFLCTPSSLLDDVTAGLSLTTLVIPQAMSYSLLAGLDPVVGLYTTLIGSFITLFGSNEFINVGMFAIVNLITGQGIAAVQNLINVDAMDVCVLMAAIVGLLQLFLWITNLSSHLDAVLPGILYFIRFTQEWIHERSCSLHYCLAVQVFAGNGCSPYCFLY